jgi:outer membrane protein assembly factor BamE (lipoprotein component of BamABCDE complex)
MKVTILLLVTLFFSSCSHPAFRNEIYSKDLNRISVGMSKNEVVTIIGEPKYSSAKANSVLYHYSLGEDDYYSWKLRRSPIQDYYVRFVNGRVESYGKLGDFDSTKDPTLNLNIKNR